MAVLPSFPTGTVTFLFTDVEGSTRLWEQTPEAMAQALARHDALICQTVAENQGHVFQTAGDGFCTAFATASDALKAAVQCQLRLREAALAAPNDDDVTLHIRIALHTGEAQEREGNYFGPTLNRVARLLATGYGQQTLLSQSTYALVRDNLPPAVRLQDLGTHRLKDLLRAETVYQVDHPDLPAQFPPLKSLDNVAHPNNLPQQVTSFIGRAKEMGEISDLLAHSRLLTLAGTGGAGKTRLSLQTGADLLDSDRFADGVWFVELAPLSDPALVPQTVAGVLGIREEAGKPLTQTLSESLKPKQVLLILDNCEHLVDACARFADSLLRNCPHLTILASSREALGIAGEQIYRVPSLSLPTTPRAETPETVAHYEAVRLFIDRALLVQPHFTVTNANAPALAQLCLNLDGIPLALELAAARARSLSVEEINARLDNRFRLLTGGSRTALPRQQTLRALIDWSYDLLTKPEKSLLRRLAVFAGGWTLAAAEAVCVGDDIEDWEVLDLLTSLTDKSLVTTAENTHATRYGLLETVRRYAADRLNESGEREATQKKHEAYFAAMAEEAARHMRDADQVKWLNHLEAEYDNLRAALEEANVETALRIAVALTRFWYVRGYHREGRERMASALAAAAPDTSSLRAKALSGAGSLTYAQGDYDAARTYFEESRRLYEALNDQPGVATQIGNLGIIASVTGNYPEAQILQEESLALCEALGDALGVANALHNLGSIAAYQEHYDEARRRYEESLTRYRELGNRGGMANALMNLGSITADQGDLTAARRYQDESLILYQELGDRRALCYSLENYATLELENGNPLRAARLWGVAFAAREQLGLPLRPYEKDTRQSRIDRTRVILGEAAFTAAWDDGAVLSLEQGVAYALDGSKDAA